MRVLKKRTGDEGSEKPKIKESVIIEKSPFSNETYEAIRLMLLRDEGAEVIGWLRSSEDSFRYLSVMLSDEGAGVPVLAADVLKRAAIGGVDIGTCEASLLKATTDRYARRLAAGALAVYYVSRNEGHKAEILLQSRDKEVSDGAREALREAGFNEQDA